MEPVKRGLQCWIEAARDTNPNGVDLAQISDLSGQANHLLPLSAARFRLASYAGRRYYEDPAANFVLGYAAAKSFTGLLSECSVFCAGWLPFAHNSCVPATWGQTLQDNWRGPRLGVGGRVTALPGAFDFLANATPSPGPSGRSRIVDRIEAWVTGNNLKWPHHFVAGITDAATESRLRLWQDGELLDEAGFSTGGLGVLDRIEYGRGNTFFRGAAAVWYDVELTPSEARETMAYLASTAQLDPHAGARARAASF